MSEVRIFTLPGFLGIPSDWKRALGNFRSAWHIPCGFYSPQLAHPDRGFWSWAESFNAYIEEQYGLPDARQRNILMGYSLGGRLAMHALLRNRRLWSGCVFVSTHPGLDWHNERVLRRERDLEWASRFENEPWEAIMHQWNNQPIFKHDKHGFNRSESDYCRKLLSATMRGWSLSFQENLRLAVQKVYTPILWVAGEKDERFHSIARFLRFNHPHSKVWIAPESGHRVPWNQSDLFIEELNQFLQKSIISP